MKYEYQLIDFPFGKFNLDRLTNEINLSPIVNSIDHSLGLSGNGSGGCSINFKSSLSVEDKVLLNGLVTAHSGEALIPKTVSNSVGIQKTIISNDVDVSSTWIPRGDLCDPNLALPLVWTPTVGKKLSVTGTMVLLSKNVLMDKELHFVGTNTGNSGNKNFNRLYNNLWEYQYGCDEYSEFSDHIRMVWRYSPIVLLSSKNAKIEVTMPNGVQTGTKGVVKLICLSEDE